MNTQINPIVIKRFFFTILLAAVFSASIVFAQTEERIYAMNQCSTLHFDSTSSSFNNKGSWHYSDGSNDQSLDAGEPGADGFFRMVCPIVRQKVGSSAGAKFFVYVDDIDSVSEVVECTMTSRRPRNGALVSSATRTRNGGQANANQQLELARSVSPSSTFGHYSLECSSNDNDPRFHGYRIREF